VPEELCVTAKETYKHVKTRAALTFTREVERLASEALE